MNPKSVGVNEYTAGLDQCDAQASCMNLIGSYKCACFNNFDGKDMTCEDENECLDSSAVCDEDAT